MVDKLVVLDRLMVEAILIVAEVISVVLGNVSVFVAMVTSEAVSLIRVRFISVVASSKASLFVSAGLVVLSIVVTMFKSVVMVEVMPALVSGVISVILLIIISSVVPVFIAVLKKVAGAGK